MVNKVSKKIAWKLSTTNATNIMVRGPAFSQEIKASKTFLKNLADHWINACVRFWWSLNEINFYSDMWLEYRVVYVLVVWLCGIGLLSQPPRFFDRYKVFFYYHIHHKNTATFSVFFVSSQLSFGISNAVFPSGMRRKLC